MSSKGQGDLPELNLQGLSLHEMTVQLSALSEARRNRSAATAGNTHTQIPSSVGDYYGHDHNTSGLVDAGINEVTLSELANWTDDSDSDPDDNEDAKSEASDVSSASTESITLSVLKPEYPTANDSRMTLHSIVTLSPGNGDLDLVDNALPHRSSGELDDLKSSDSRYDGDLSTFLESNNAEADESTSSTSAPKFKARFHAVPNYGCRVSPGFGYQGLNVLKPSASSGWRIIPGMEDEQIFTRAPNFRTPGGYKPPEFEKDPRILTETEVHDEVKQMYAEAQAERELEAQIIPNVHNKESVQHLSPSPAASSKLDGGGDFKSNKPKTTSPKQKQGTSAPKSKPAKRGVHDEKVNGDGDGPLPSLNLGDLDFPGGEVKEPIFTRSRSYLCHDSDQSTIEVQPASIPDLTSPYTGDISRCLPRRVTKRLSPESRKVNLQELDRIWKDIQDTKHKMEHDMESLRYAKVSEPFACRPGPSGSSTSGTKNLSRSATDPDSDTRPLSPILKRDTSANFDRVELDRSPTKFIEPLPMPRSKSLNKVSFSDTTTPIPLSVPGSASSKSRPRSKKLTKKVGSKGKSIPLQKKKKKSSTQENSTVSIEDDDEEVLHIPFIPKELQDVELETLLKETDLEESDLDDILNQITEFHPPGHLFNEHESPLELTSALQQLQISDWAKAGAGEYVEKFYEEKYKRQHCEKEVLGLQKKLLEFKERVAVLEGILKTKEFTVYKYTKLWEGLAQQWRAHEKGCKANTSRLEAENTSLKAQVEESKGRIGDYEKELGKALQLSTDFKQQIDEVLDNTEKDKQEWAEERQELQMKLDQLDVTLREGKAGKEATVRALRECQLSLDKARADLEVTSENVNILRTQSLEDASKIVQLSQEKEALEVHVSDVEKEKQTIENDFEHVSRELEKEKHEKELLELKLRGEKEKLIQEGERLHDYYTAKLKGILTAESEKVIAAEKAFIQTHENKLKLVQEGAERRIEELREKYEREQRIMKCHFDSQMEFLRRDNETKGRLIGAVSQQLRNHSEKDSRDISFQEYPIVSKLTEINNFESALTRKPISGTQTSSLLEFNQESEPRSISELVYDYNERLKKSQQQANGHVDYHPQ